MRLHRRMLLSVPVSDLGVLTPPQGLRLARLYVPNTLHTACTAACLTGTKPGPGMQSVQEVLSWYRDATLTFDYLATYSELALSCPNI